MKNSLQIFMDRIAITGSAICLLHCIAMPVFLSIFPSSITVLLQDEQFHQLMVWLVIHSSLLAVFIGCRKHKDSWVLAGVVIGILVMAFTAIFGHDALGESGEKIFTIIGATVLAISHMRNYKLCRQSSCNHSV